MIILPLVTPCLKPGDDLAAVLAAASQLQDDDIVVLSSKAVATVEGAAIDLSALHPSEQAKTWSVTCGRSPAFCEAVLQEVSRCHGEVLSACPGALLTELVPPGLQKGSILTANAGLDESNVETGFCIGWPLDPTKSATKLRQTLEATLSSPPIPPLQFAGEGGAEALPRLGVIITDSCCHPRRLGVSAFALTVSGFQPLQSEVGKRDLFGRELHITTEAVADQLATAANFLMGNAAQSMPAAIIRDHGLGLSPFEGWVPGIGREEDLFQGL